MHKNMFLANEIYLNILKFLSIHEDRAFRSVLRTLGIYLPILPLHHRIRRPIHLPDCYSGGTLRIYPLSHVIRSYWLHRLPICPRNLLYLVRMAPTHPDITNLLLQTTYQYEVNCIGIEGLQPSSTFRMIRNQTNENILVVDSDLPEHVAFAYLNYPWDESTPFVSFDIDHRSYIDISDP